MGQLPNTYDRSYLELVPRVHGGVAEERDDGALDFRLEGIKNMMPLVQMIEDVEVVVPLGEVMAQTATPRGCQPLYETTAS